MERNESISNMISHKLQFKARRKDKKHFFKMKSRTRIDPQVLTILKQVSVTITQNRNGFNSIVIEVKPNKNYTIKINPNMDIGNKELHYSSSVAVSPLLLLCFLAYLWFLKNLGSIYAQHQQDSKLIETKPMDMNKISEQY